MNNNNIPTYIPRRRHFENAFLLRRLDIRPQLPTSSCRPITLQLPHRVCKFTAPLIYNPRFEQSRPLAFGICSPSLPPHPFFLAPCVSVVPALLSCSHAPVPLSPAPPVPALLRTCFLFCSCCCCCLLCSCSCSCLCSCSARALFSYAVLLFPVAVLFLFLLLLLILFSCSTVLLFPVTIAFLRCSLFCLYFFAFWWCAWSSPPVVGFCGILPFEGLMDTFL